ncbi:nucleosidase [Kocuria palustris]|uniref:nucleosidase n=1 Tax=Kocuria palustris TaxID=71999 RepID=UPI00119CC9B9|nr:nucleosidase [Kocuria palustris]
MNRVLVIAAHPAETAQLPPEADVAVTGIGMSRAAALTARAVLERAPSPEQRRDLVVVNLGSCGGLQPGLSGIFEPSVVLNRDVDAELLRAMGSEPDDRIPLAELGQVGDGSILATGDSLVAGGPVRDALAERAQLVDMEGFAVATACRELGVRMRMVKHVSDDAGAQALEWLDRVQVSARELAAWYAQSIEGLRRAEPAPAGQDGGLS